MSFPRDPILSDPQAPSGADRRYSPVLVGGALMVILLAAVVLRLSFAVGPAASDDMRYIRAASVLAQGDRTDIVDHAYVRAAFIGWLALWVKLGAGIAGLVLSDVVLSVAILQAVFWLALKWTSPPAALLAVLWLAFFPLELLCSGLVVSDHLGLLLGLLSAGLAYDGLRAAPRSATWKLCASGILAGLAFSAKEIYVVLPVIYGLWSCLQIRPIPRALGRCVIIGASALLVFGLEHLFFGWWTGDWAYRYHAISRVYTPERSAQHIGMRELLYYPLQLLANPGVCGAVGWLLGAALLRTFGKLRDAHFVLLWTLCFFVFLQYGSSSLTRYQPLPKQWRYMHPMVVPAFIALGHWVLVWWRSRTLGRWGTVLLSGGILLSGIHSANERAAEGFYSEQSLRCLEAARTRYTGEAAASLALPDWVARGTALDLRRGIAGWPTVNLADGLQPDETRALIVGNSGLLVPEILWYHKRDDESYREVRRELQNWARVETLEDWSSPLDRLKSRIPSLRSHARKSVIGRCYWPVQPPYLAGHTPEPASP